jgi:hypothetical protein
VERLFSDYQKNKYVSREGVDLFLKEMKSRILGSSNLTFVPAGASHIVEEWYVEKKADKKYLIFSILTGKKRLKAELLNLLSKYNTIGLILITNTNQKYTKEDLQIKEMWGYRLHNKNDDVKLEKIPYEELYEYCTTDFSSGKNIPPKEEVVYCGPDGKVCGWDMI